MKYSNYYNAIDSTVIFFGSLLIFLVGLRHQEIVGFDSRLYAFALEMFRHGFGWFPRTAWQYYPDYPVTPAWIIYLLATGLGTLNKLVAVLPSAIASALTVMMTYRLGTLHNRLWGWNAVILLLFTLEFAEEARAIAFDQYIALITTVCFYLIYSAKLLQTERRLLWLFPLFVIGFAFRGPIGLIVPTGVVCIFYLLEKEYKKFFTVGIISSVLLVFCFFILLALAFHTGGLGFAKEVLAMEGLGRIQDVKPVPFYFYFIESLGTYAVTYPLMLLMLPVVLFWFRLRNKKLPAEKQFLLYLLGWILVVLIGLSVPADKKPRYILSIAPALALFCAYLFSYDDDNGYLKKLRKVFYWCCYFLPSICLFAIYFFHRNLAFLHLHYLVLIGLFVVLQIMMFLFYYLQKSPSFVLLTAMLTFLVVNMVVVEPTNLKINSVRNLVLQVEAMREKEHVSIVFYREGWDGLAVKYAINMPHEEKLIFLATPEELLAFHQPAIFITSVEYFAGLPDKIKRHFQYIQSGKIGHDKVVVFRRMS